MRASGPVSVGRSVSHLLLNPPSVVYFNTSTFVFLWGRECSPSPPSSYATPRPDVLGFINCAYSGSFIGSADDGGI